MLRYQAVLLPVLTANLFFTLQSTMPVQRRMASGELFDATVVGSASRDGLKEISSHGVLIEKPRLPNKYLKDDKSLCSKCKKHSECRSLSCDQNTCVTKEWNVKACKIIKKGGPPSKKNNRKTCERCDSYWQCAPLRCINGQCANNFLERRRCVGATFTPLLDRSWRLCSSCQRDHDCPGGSCIRGNCVQKMQQLKHCQIYFVVKSETVGKSTQSIDETSNSKVQQGKNECDWCTKWFECKSHRCKDGRCINSSPFQMTRCSK